MTLGLKSLILQVKYTLGHTLFPLQSTIFWDVAFPLIQLELKAKQNHLLVFKTYMHHHINSLKIIAHT